MTTIACPQCGQRFGVAAHLYGKQVACTSCGGALRIPNPSPTQPLPLPPATQSLPAPAVAYPSSQPAAKGDSQSYYAIVAACVVGGLAVFCLLLGFGVTMIWRAVGPSIVEPHEEVSPTETIAAAGAYAERDTGNERPAGPPSVPERFVFRPTFETRFGVASAGTAFIVSVPNQATPIALTAIHLLGPAGGLEHDLPGAELPDAVRRVVLEACFGQQSEFDIGGQALLMPSAPLSEPSVAGDVAAFWVIGSADVNALPLADKDPVEGEPVWLAGPVIAGAPRERRLHAAQVHAFEDRKLYYEYENSQIELRATSGAPVLNAQGEVVAINLGGGTLNGALIGVGNPVSRFRSQLVRAAQTPPTLASSPARASSPPASSPSATPATNQAAASLAQRQAIYRTAKLIGSGHQRSLAARDRHHQKMLDRMKAKPPAKTLERMNKMNEDIQERLTQSHQKAIEELCRVHEITLDRLAEILDEGDSAGWSVPRGPGQ